MIHVMVDLETLGNTPGSVIVAIGAAALDDEHPEQTFAPFYVRVDPESCVRLGQKIDASTVLWWLAQSEDARNELTRDPSERVSLGYALQAFSGWMEGCGERKSVLIWGNGASFDCVLLEEAYRAAQTPAPFDFWQHRCWRTLRATMRGFGVDFPSADSKTRAHVALDDAQAQLEGLKYAYEVLGKELRA